MIRGFSQFALDAPASMIEERLREPEGFVLPKLNFRMRAGTGSVVEEGDHDQINLAKVVFVQFDEDHWVRLGSIRQGSLKLERSAELWSISGELEGLDYYDREEASFLTLRRYEFRPRLPQRLKFETFTKLLDYARNPFDWVELKEKTEELRFAFARWSVFNALAERWGPSHRLVFEDGRERFTIRAESMLRTPREGLVELTTPQVEIQQLGDDGTPLAGQRKVFAAQRGSFEVRRGEGAEAALLTLDLFDVGTIRLGDEVVPPDRRPAPRNHHRQIPAFPRSHFRFLGRPDLQWTKLLHHLRSGTSFHPDPLQAGSRCPSQSLPTDRDCRKLLANHIPERSPNFCPRQS